MSIELEGKLIIFIEILQLNLVVLFLGISWHSETPTNHFDKSIFKNGKSEFVVLSREEFSEAYDSVYLFVNDQSQAVFYFQNIFTPVCEDNSLCKPVYMTLIWDLLGNYMDYRLDSITPLTKIDHIPFSNEEYQKLHSVLTDENSILSSYSKETITELYRRSEGQHSLEEVDAITGATPEYIKDQTIEGALYTCHTLWNLCRGKISEQLLNYTENHLLNDDLMHQMISSGDLKLIEFSFQHLSSFGDSRFHAEIIQVIQDSDQITASQIIRYLPKKLVEERDFNLQLWNLFDRVHFLSQRQILDQFTHCKKLSDKLLLDLISYTKEAKESQFVQILKIILNQSDIPENSDQLLVEITKNKKESLSGAVVILLRHAEVNSRNKDLINSILKILE